MKPRLILLFLLPALLFCEGERHPIPEFSFQFTIDITNPEFSDLQAIPGYVYVTGGAYEKGIIIYRKDFDKFAAYDRSCPHDPETGLIEVVEANIGLAVDSVCGSEFSLQFDGTVQKGPSKHPLKMYNTQYNPNTHLLEVYN